MNEHDNGRGVGIIGAGSIGVAFAVVFARAGFRVRLFEANMLRTDAAIKEIRARAEDLARFELIDESPEVLTARVEPAESIQDAVGSAELVQECAPEQRELKTDLLQKLDRLAPPETILASSSSAIPISAVASGLAGARRCLVAHPGNPPYLIPVIELVPAPFTDPAVVERASDIYRSAGLSPVRLQKEVDGFVFNRLQGALLREAYCLVRDGVASVEDIDLVVRDGLGMRWSVVGPFETVDLNTRGGIASHAQKMGPAYERMGAQRGQYDPWTPDLVAKVEHARRAVLPLSGWDERVAWRDRTLMALLRERKRQQRG